MKKKSSSLMSTSPAPRATVTVGETETMWTTAASKLGSCNVSGMTATGTSTETSPRRMVKVRGPDHAS